MTATKPPFDTDHRIGRLDVVASVHDLDNAMAYRPRLESLAWEKFPDVIHNIFDKFASADAVLRIDKLELDLGTVRPAFLETDAIAALERALEEALASAIHDAKSSEHDDRQLIDTPIWRLQQMESFLRDGRPELSVDPSGFDPTTEAIWLMDNQPEKFVAMLDRQLHHRHALDRLFLQIGAAGRERLVKLLAPSQATDTIGLMKAIDALLSVFSASSQRISGAGLRQKVWVKTIAFLVEARGSSCDPKRLLTQILSNLAAQTKISLLELISSISDIYWATDHRSYRHPDLGHVLAAMKAEQHSQKPEIAVRAITDRVPSSIEEWRTLFNRQDSSGPTNHVRFASLTSIQYEALLTAWAPDGRILEISRILVRSFSQAAGVETDVADKIDQAIFEHVAAHIDKVADPSQLWRHVLSIFKPTSDDAGLAAAVIKILLSDSASTKRQIAAILDRAVEQDANISGQAYASTDPEQAAGEVGPGQKATHVDPGSPDTGSEQVLMRDRNEGSAAVSNLKSDIVKAIENGGSAWRQLLQKYAWTADERLTLFDIVSPGKLESLIKRISGDAELATTIIDILLSDSTSAERQIAAILDRAVDQASGKNGQSSASVEPEQKAGRGQPETPTGKSDWPLKPNGHDGSTSHSSLSADIVKAMASGGAQWRRLLQKHGQTADDRIVLAELLSPQEFASLLAAISGDPAMPAMQNALISAVSQANGADATASIKAALLEYLAMQGDGPVESLSLSQHLLAAAVPAAEYDKIRSELIEILSFGNSMAEQELAACLAEDTGRKSDRSSSQFRKPAQHTDDPAQDSARPKANRRSSKTGLDHSDVVRRILEYPTEWRALLRTYAQNAEQRTRLLAAMNAAQFGTLLQAATGDPKAAATQAAFLSATSKVIGINAEARAQSVILEYLASHDSGPVEIEALWTYCLEALLPAEWSASEKSARSRKIFDLLPYDDDRLSSEIFYILAAAGRQTAFKPGRDQSGSKPLSNANNTAFIASVLESDDSSLRVKLRAAIPQLPSHSPLPAIRFGNRDFETIVRRLRPAEIAPLFDGVKAMLELQSSRPFIPMHQDRLAELVRYLVIADLIWQSQERMDLVSFWAKLIDRLAKSANMSAHSLASRLQAGFLQSGAEQKDIAALQKAIGTLAAQPEPADSETAIADDDRQAEVTDDGDPADNMSSEGASRLAQNADFVPALAGGAAANLTQSDREAVAAYFGKGSRLEQREILVRAATQEPLWLAEFARRSVSSSTDATVVAERLLFWLRPPEILEFLAPTVASALVQSARNSGDDEIWWTETIAALLAGQAPFPNAAQRVPADSETEIADDRDAEVTDDGGPVDNMSHEDSPPVAQNQQSTTFFEGDRAANLTPSDRETMAAYLAKGARRDQVEILVRAAIQDPLWLAELARSSVSSTNDATVVAERLLFWLMPSEILAFLAPALARALMHRAPQSGKDEGWWIETIAALLMGDVPSTADAIERDNSPVPHFDRLALLQRWLNGGNPPENIAGQFLRLTQAERISLLRADTVDATLQKIQHAAAALGPEKTEALLQDIIGWAQLKKGPLASLIGDSKADQQVMLWRAAAANLVSTEIDLNILTDPLPDFAQVNQMDGPENSDDSGDHKFTLPDLMAWLDGRPVKADEISRLREQFDLLFDKQDSQFLSYISAHFYREEQRNRWVGLLPKASLGRLLYLIAPNDAHILHDGILLLTTAGAQLLTFGSPPLDPEKLWISVFDAVARPGKIDLAAILSRLVADAASGDAGLAPKIRARALALAGTGGHIIIAAALRRTPPPEAEHDVARSSGKLSNDLSWESFENGKMRDAEDETSDQPIYIANAGLILINPFLPAFFERLDLLSRDENDKPYVDTERAASRAVHLLQYLVTGQTATPEPLLFLNKIICGLPTGTPVASGIEPESKDIEICDGLLAGILENWPALHGTSVDGLRETFLQREGRLHYVDQKWTLVIQRKTLDILKDQIAWNTAVIYHPWMSDPIHVTW